MIEGFKTNLVGCGMQSSSDIAGAPWLLAERSLPSELAFPQNCSQRIKYTCFDVSNSYLIFGATSGGLYVFNREPCQFIQLIPNKEGTITKIKLSPDEKSIAFSTHKGSVCVCDRGSAVGSYLKSSILQLSKEHHGNEITFMVWSENSTELYIGDDVGVVSILHISKSITKNVFQTSAFQLMNLDSRIVQLDIKENLLLVSTLTKCFICDTTKEHYAQIGQKLRDGEFGACFYYEINNGNQSDTAVIENDQSSTEHNKTFDVISKVEGISLDKLEFLKIFCARPSSRFWEVKVDGTVICTHQFKQLLAVPPNNIISMDDFDNDNFDFPQSDDKTVYNPQILSFAKIHVLKNRFIVTYTKDGIYIFDPKIPAVVLWTDKYSDIQDCRIVDELIYVWRSNGNISLFSTYAVDKFLLKCYTSEKYKLCAQICAYYADSLIKSIPSSDKLHLIQGLGEKLLEKNENDLHDEISPVLEEISKIKTGGTQKLKSGIVLVENSFLARAASADEDENALKSLNSMDLPNRTNNDDNDASLFHPEAIRVIKDLSNSFSDKLSVGTSKIMQKWNDLEDKVKRITSEKMYNDPLNVREDVEEGSEAAPVERPIIEDNDDIVYKGNNIVHKEDNDDIVYKENEEVDTNNLTNQIENEDPDSKINVTIKTIHRHIKLSDINKSDCIETICALLTDITCDIYAIYQIVNKLEQYMISSGDSPKYSYYHCNRIFLHCVSKMPNLNETMDSAMANDVVCSYLLEAFININSSAKSSCDCGYPLPNAYSSQTPEFSDILDVFIEKRWSASQTGQCYDICKKVPYMWRKILFLRRNEDLVNLLFLILQMLDEELLYVYLPQFTVETWKIAIKLLGTLKRQVCLNCGQSFQPQIGNGFHDKLMLNWNSIGALMLKTVGVLTPNILKMYSNLIPGNELSVKFYHSCLFLKLFEKYDGTINNRLVDTIYECYDYEDAVYEMSNHLQSCIKGDLPHTALPLVAASKSRHWGLKVCENNVEESTEDLTRPHQPDLLKNLLDNNNLVAFNNVNRRHYRIGMDVQQTMEFLNDLCPNKECFHCCLELTSNVLVRENGLWVFSCGHTFHGICLTVLKIKLCPICFKSS